MHGAVRVCAARMRGALRRHYASGPQVPAEATLADDIRGELEAAMAKAEDERGRMRAALQEATASKGLPSAVSRLDEQLLANNITPVAKAFPPEAVAAFRLPPRESFTQPSNPQVCKTAVIGLENSGKSSLVNNIVGDHIAPVSFRSFSTRRWTTGVTTVGSKQVVLLDTPQLFAPLPELVRKPQQPQQPQQGGTDAAARGSNSASINSRDATPYRGIDRVFLKEAGRRLMSTEAAWESVYDADAVVVCINGKSGQAEREVDAMLEALSHRVNALDRQPKVFAAITRIEGHPEPEKVAGMLAGDLMRSSPVRLERVVPIVRSDATSYLRLRSLLAAAAVPADWPFPANARTNQTPPELIEAVILEKAVKHFQGAAGGGLTSKFMNVDVVGWTERADGHLQIDALVVVASFKMRGIFLKNLSQITDECQKAASRHLGRQRKLFFSYHVVEVPLDEFTWQNPYGHYKPGWSPSDVDLTVMESDAGTA